MVDDIELNEVQVKISTLTLDGKRITKSHFEQFIPIGLDRVVVVKKREMCEGLKNGVICTHRHISKQVDREAITTEWGRMDADSAARVRQSMAGAIRWLSMIDGVIYDCHAHLPFDPAYGGADVDQYSDELIVALRSVPHILIV